MLTILMFSSAARTVSTSITVFFALVMLISTGLCGKSDSHAVQVGCENGVCFLRAYETSLDAIVEKLRENQDIEITGVDHRYGELVTMDSEGRLPEIIIRRLLKRLNMSNYAFEYRKNKLIRVLVLPQSLQDDLGKKQNMPLSNRQQENKKASVQVAKIEKVPEGSQTQIDGFMPGDLIIEYNGRPINRGPIELVEEMKKTSDQERVEVGLIREGYTLRVFINGGNIDAQLKSQTMGKEEFEKYLR